MKGNREADMLPKVGRDQPFMGPELVCGILLESTKKHKRLNKPMAQITGKRYQAKHRQRSC